MIAALRRRADWDQSELAALSGLSQSTLSRIERGEVSPTYVQMQALATAFRMTVAELEAYIDQSIHVAEGAAAAAPSPTRPKKGTAPPWWAVLGGVALGALVAFAVAVVVGDEDAAKEPSPRPPKD